MVTSFAIVAGGFFTRRSAVVVTVVGSSSLLADGVSMGISEYLSSYSAQEAAPIRKGAICFASFVLCGGIPLLTFVSSGGALLAAAGSSLFVLLLLALFRTLVAKERVGWALLQTSGLGGIAGGVALGVAALASHLVEGDD